MKFERCLPFFSHPRLSILIFFLSSLSISMGSLSQEIPNSNDPNFELGLFLGSYEAEDQSTGANLDFKNSADWHFGATYSDSDNSTSSSKNTSFYINSDYSAAWVGRLSFSSNDQTDVLESNDFEIAAGWNIGNWYLEGSYISGDMELGDPLVEPQILEILNEIGALNAERDGFGIEANYFAENWLLRIAYGSYEFELDGEVTAESFQQALQQLTPQERIDLLRNIRDFQQVRATNLVRLSNIRNHQIYRNAINLVDEEISFDYTYLFEKLALGAGLWNTNQALGNRDSTTYYISSDYPFSQSFSLGSLLSTSNEDSNIYAEINLRLRW